jgi:aspartokinase
MLSKIPKRFTTKAWSMSTRDHIAAAESHITDETIRAKLIKEVRGECQEIIDYRLAAERWHLEIDSRSKDRIISFGEKLSCRFIAAVLQDRVGAACSIVFLHWLTWDNRELSQNMWICQM